MKAIELNNEITLHVAFFFNGQKREEGTYVNGKKHGVFHGWYENGAKAFEETYFHGVLIGYYILWDRNGTTISEGEITFVEKNAKKIL